MRRAVKGQTVKDQILRTANVDQVEGSRVCDLGANLSEVEVIILGIEINVNNEE